MGKSLEYKDNRQSLFWSEFSDVALNTEPMELTTSRTITRADGDYTYNQMEVRTLLTLIHQFERTHRQLKQRVSSVEGQLEYITKNGVDAYITKILDIKALHPKPTE